MNVADIVYHHALWRPGHSAVVCGATRFTYAQLADRVGRLASALVDLGVGEGTRVGVLSTNSAEYVEIVYAIAEVGAIWVPINFRLAVPEVAFILQDSGAAVLFYSPDLAPVADQLRGSLGKDMKLLPLGGSADAGYQRLLDNARPGPRTPLRSDMPFAIMYTSGTTGRPKGALLTHRQFLSGTYYLSTAFRAVPEDRKLQAIPQFHAGGAIYQFAYMLAGATIVLLPVFNPDQALFLMDTEGITAAGFVPAMLQAVSERAAGTHVSFPHLRQVMYGGSSIAATALLRAMNLFQAEFLQTYGQTEAGVIVTVLDGAAHARASKGGEERLLRSCGKPLLGYDVRLLEASGLSASTGEMCVRSDSLMTEYWKRPDATATTLVDGWLRTGDVATRDEEGFYYIVDRKVDMIVTGGENVYALEVENVIAEHPNVAEIAIVGVPDARWGEAVLAVVVPRAGRAPTLEEIRGHCRDKLGGFKIPKRVEEIDALPRNASGKILKHVLRARFTA